MHTIFRTRAGALFLALVTFMATGWPAPAAFAACAAARARPAETASLRDVKDWVREEGAQRVAGTPIGTYEYFGKSVAFWVALRRYPDGRVCGRYGGRYFAPQRTFRTSVVLGQQLSNGAWQVRLDDKTGTVRTGFGAMLLFDMEDLVVSDGPVAFAGGMRFAVMRPISPLPPGRERAAQGSAASGLEGHDR